MKKSSNKFIVALVMLLISAISLSTASYAWFSMNKEVTATGMQITANSTNIYLLINTGDKNTAEAIQALNTTTIALTVSDEDSDLMPSAHEELGSTTDASSPSKWYTKIADNPTESASTGESAYLTNLDGYVIKRTCYITLAEGSTGAANLKVAANVVKKASETATKIDPVSVIVANGTTVLEFNKTNSWENTGVLAEAVTAAGVITVDVYIYYDGNNSEVYTNNTADLAAAIIDLTFTVDN